MTMRKELLSLGRRPVVGLLAAAATALSLGVPKAQAQDDFYAGKTITIIVGLAPGGIYDISARLVARYLTRFIPGNPDIVVENQPGGGGLLVANRLYVDPRAADGTTIALIQRAMPLLPLQGASQATFDPTEFSWIGSLSAYQNDAYLMLVNDDASAQSAEALISGDESVIMGVGNVGSSSRVITSILKEGLGMNIEMVTGYQGAAPIFVAMEQGEVEGQTIDLSAVLAQKRQQWENGEFRALVQFGRTERREDLPDVPTARELAPDEDTLSLIKFAELPFFMSTPFVASPDLPDERREMLQTAFLEMAADPDFLAEAERIGLEINAIDGDAILDLLADAAKTPAEVIERYNEVTEIQLN